MAKKRVQFRRRRRPALTHSDKRGWELAPLGARTAFLRVASGKPMFDEMAFGKAQARSRRNICEWLIEEGYIRRTKRGPEVTQLGRESLTTKPKPGSLTPRERTTMEKFYKMIGPTAMAERLGRSCESVVHHAKRMGLVGSGEAGGTHG